MKTVVFGAGYWGVNYIRELAGNLACVVEPDEDKARWIRDRYNIPVVPDIEHFQDPFEAAIIATPPDTHVDIAMKLLENGAERVLIEKPAATSTKEFNQLYPWRDNIMVGHLYLYHPMMKWIKNSLAKVPIDHVYFRRTNDGPVRTWQDAKWDLATHDISIANYLFGTPVGVRITSTRDWCLLVLNHIAIDSLIYVSWLGSPKIRQIELVPAGNGERIIYDDVRTVLEVSPLRRMLDDFHNPTGWDERCSFNAAHDVIKIVEQV